MSSSKHKPSTNRALPSGKTRASAETRNSEGQDAGWQPPPPARTRESAAHQLWGCGLPRIVASARAPPGTTSLLLLLAAGASRQPGRAADAPGARVGSGDCAGVRRAVGPASGLKEARPRRAAPRPAGPGA